jgi:hypothetical protein
MATSAASASASMSTVEATAASVAAAHAAQAAADENFAARHVAAFFEKFERDHYECQELLSQAVTHWLLSADDHRSGAAGGVAGLSGVSVEAPPGLIARMSAVRDMRLVLLVPVDDTDTVTGTLDMREVFDSCCMRQYVLLLPVTYAASCCICH